jgi:hypothetical protein
MVPGCNGFAFVTPVSAFRFVVAATVFPSNRLLAVFILFIAPRFSSLPAYHAKKQAFQPIAGQ